MYNSPLINVTYPINQEFDENTNLSLNNSFECTAFYGSRTVGYYNVYYMFIDTNDNKLL